MKADLEKYRFGLPHQESWRLNPRYDPRRFLVDETARVPRYAEDWSLDEPAATDDLRRAWALASAHQDPGTIDPLP